jgi:two-component system CheB/CheR fusion protein
VPSHYETVFRRKEGATFPVEISASRIIWQNQTMVLGFFRDITARKRMANEILQIGDWEKMRIGQDLHDTLGQQLAGIAYLSQALARGECARFGGAIDKGMNQLVIETRHAMELVRQVVHGLTPITPGPNGLANALRSVAEKAQRRHGTTCDLRVDEGLTVSDGQTAAHLFFIAQEAVTNALRHGQVRHILIRLARREPQAELLIVDDGIGLPVGVPAGPGMGLRIMQHRADLIGGTLVVERGESGGTRVSCRYRHTG